MPVRTFNQVSYDDIYISRILFTSHTPLSYTDGGLAIAWKRANFMFSSCPFSWVIVTICTTVYIQRERERERENILFKPYPHWVVSVVAHPAIAHNNRLFTRHNTHVFLMLVSSFCLYIGFGVSIPLHIICLFFCIGFPTNKILFCVGCPFLGCWRRGWTALGLQLDCTSVTLAGRGGAR